VNKKISQRKLKRWALWSVLLLTLSGAPELGAQNPPSAAHAEVDSSYVFQPGDRLKIKIYPEDEFIRGGEMEVSSDGGITLSLVGKIQIGGKSVLESERIIGELLERDYIINPQVVIEVLKYQSGSFIVLGQVTRPGTYNFPPGALKVTLLQAVSLAGGFSEIANIKRIKVVRKKTGESLQVSAEDIITGRRPDVEISVDDMIHVSESRF
jgi:polysaccharide biosynthesis/export protein